MAKQKDNLQYATKNFNWLSNIKTNLSNGKTMEFVYWCSKGAVWKEAVLGKTSIDITYGPNIVLSGTIIAQDIMSIKDEFYHTQFGGSIKNGLNINTTENDLLYEIQQTLESTITSTSDEIGAILIKADAIFIGQNRPQKASNQKYIRNRNQEMN